MIISSRNDLPRRSFLRTTAGSAVLASTPLTRPASARTDADGGPAGYLVFTYDDGIIEDYEKTFRVHEEYDVPGCVAASPGMLGSSNDWLDPDQLREMYDAGWEVLSHTINHRAIGEIPSTEDAETGDTEIAVASNRHGRYPGDPVVLLDAEGIVAEAVVAGRNGSGDGQYIELEEPIEADVSGNDCYVRYTDEFTREILAESKAQLEEIGGENQVTGFVYPYERHDGLAAEIVPENYETTPRAFTGNGLDPSHGSDPFSIFREYYEEGRMNEEELAAFLDTVANEPDFGSSPHTAATIPSPKSGSRLRSRWRSTATSRSLPSRRHLTSSASSKHLIVPPRQSTRTPTRPTLRRRPRARSAKRTRRSSPRGRSPGSSTSSSRCSPRSSVPVNGTTA